MGFKYTSNPFEDYLKWVQNPLAMTMAARTTQYNPQQGTYDLNPLALKNSGAPDQVMRQGGDADKFLEAMRQMFGQQLQSRFPGMQNVNLQSLMGGRAGYSPMDASQMNPMEILKALQQGAIFNQDPRGYM